MIDRRVLAAAAFAIVVAMVSWRAATNLNVPGQPEVPRFALADFRDAIYYPVVAMLEGHNPYDHADYTARYPILSPFPIYSPLTLAIHLPLGFVDLVTAEYVYYFLNVALMLPIAFLALRLCGIQPLPWQWLGLAALLVATRPGQTSLFLGQYTPTMVLAAYAALHWARSRPGWAALALAVTTIKPTFGVPLLLLVAASGSPRPAAAGAALGIVGAALPAALLAYNAGGVRELLASVAAGHTNFTASSLNSVHGSLTRLDLAALIGRWATDAPSALLDASICIAVLAVAAAAVHRLRDATDPRARALSASLVCIATLAAVYHHAYDALLLAFPLLAALSGRLIGAHGGSRAALGLLLLIPTLNYLTSFSAVAALGIEGDAQRVVASINGVAITAALAICLALAARHPTVAVRRRRGDMIRRVPQPT